MYATVAMPRPPPSMVQQQPQASAEPKEQPDQPEEEPSVAPSSGLPPTAPTSQGSGYSRKKKSLGVWAENFMQRFQNCAPGTEVIVDEAAQDLGVERRRIYDVVNILESIQVVVKKGKNTYSWMGKQCLPDIFGKLQAQAIAEYPEDAVKYGLKTPDDDATDDGSITTTGTGGKPSRRGSMSSNASEDSKNSFRSLAKLSQQFLQVFLVGYDVLSLPQASEMIQGTLSAEAYAAIGTAHAHIASRFDPTAAPPPCLDNPAEFRRAAQRGLKTKIRRLYDIANVFLSVGILRKVEGATGSSTIDVLSSNRRPNFAWAYEMSIKEVQEMYEKKLATGHFQASPAGHPKLLCLPQDKVLNIAATPMAAHPSQAPTPLSKNTGKTPSSSGSADERTPPSSEDAGTKPKAVGRSVNGDILSRIHQSGACYQTPFTARKEVETEAPEVI